MGEAAGVSGSSSNPGYQILQKRIRQLSWRLNCDPESILISRENLSAEARKPRL